jgi:nucleoside-diphosphate-sugar epimerase
VPYPSLSDSVSAYSSSVAFPVQPRVLVIGGAGYVGSVLTRRLLGAGYQVRVFDALFYGAGSLSGLDDEQWLEVVVGDTRDGSAVREAMSGVDTVVHLGELVGDPACALDPATTVAINLDATRRIADEARRAGVSRLIYPSSCSVYGANDEVVDEQSPLNPVSLYAETKLLAEEELAIAAAEGLETVILRLATVYGMSPRPRFDLVVNLFAARGLVDRHIAVHGGDQWRPFVHVADVADAMVACLQAPAALVAGETLNVGSDGQNHTVGEVAELVHRRVPEATLSIEPIDDHRNYRVSFARIRELLGFEPARGLDDGIAEIHAALSDGSVLDYRAARHSNLQTMRASLEAAIPRSAVGTEVGYAADALEQPLAADPGVQLAS